MRTERGENGDMADFDDLKLIGISLPIAVAAWRWLRSHNDRTLGPPAPAPSDAQIEQLVRQGRRIEAIKAIRGKYAYDLKRAKQHFDSIRARLRHERG